MRILGDGQGKGQFAIFARQACSKASSSWRVKRAGSHSIERRRRAGISARNRASSRGKLARRAAYRQRVRGLAALEQRQRPRKVVGVRPARGSSATLFVFSAAAARTGIVAFRFHTQTIVLKLEARSLKLQAKCHQTVEVGSVGSAQRRIRPCNMREISSASWIIALACEGLTRPASSPM